ncbi:MAG: Rieske (2Fe-2S) protein [Nocardiopsaceae bacterium]|jgi:ubiquinol-cytochrome c reductase iron-sulfur subunit|nr:Rieske (2Fe-2S) protein [Nocardiopsaceae bacterium]
MTDPNADHEADRDRPDGQEARDSADESRGARHRVIGTPPPAEARTMLATPAPGSPGGPPQARPRELPAEPEDPASAKRGERIVAACFLIATLAGLGFIAAYVIFPMHTVLRTQHSNLALGLTLGVAFLALACGIVFWFRNVMPTVELTEARKPLRSSDEDRAAFKETFEEGTEASQFVKRPLLRRTLIAATVPLAVAPIVLLRDLGPLPRKTLDHTVWRKGMRLLDYGSNTPIRPADFSSPGGMITVVPDGFEDDFNALAKATCIIIKFAPNQVDYTAKSSPVPGKVVQNWAVDNIIAYSKICTHVGCPAALYEQTTHHILCPCHQSTFDATRGAEVIFGPATRALPQLPMTVDAQGFLVAKHDFTEPVGPSFWERGPSS